MNETCGGPNIKCQPGLRCKKEIGMCVPDGRYNRFHLTSE